MEWNNEPIIGAVYRHYKGGLYRVVGVGKHTRDEERLVVYAEADRRDMLELWCRPLSEFSGRVVGSAQRGAGALRFERTDRT